MGGHVIFVWSDNNANYNATQKPKLEVVFKCYSLLNDFELCLGEGKTLFCYFWLVNQKIYWEHRTAIPTSSRRRDICPSLATSEWYVFQETTSKSVCLHSGFKNCFSFGLKIYISPWKLVVMLSRNRGTAGKLPGGNKYFWSWFVAAGLYFTQCTRNDDKRM